MRLFLIVLLTSTLSSFSNAQTNDSLSTYISDKISSAPSGFALSIALINDGKVEYIGAQIRENEVQFLDLKDSLFEIGSLTKVFTSSVLAQSIIDRKLRPKKTINKVFPFKLNDNIKLSYLSLSNHTSGMYRLPSNLLPLLFQNPKNPYKDYTFEMFNHYLKNELQLEENKKPKYAYSNLGAGTLSYALALKHKVSFEELMSQLTSKYNMHLTSYQGDVSFDGIGPDNEITENWDFIVLKGAGGLISNTSDLSKFVLAQFDSNNKALTLTRKETFRINDDLSIGMGWHIINPDSVNKKYWHNGGTGGYTSSMSFNPDSQTGVIVLSNISALHKKAKLIDSICFELLEALQP